MKTRKISAMIVCIAALVVIIGYSIFKVLAGKEVGFQEVIAIGALLMLFFSTLTWGNKREIYGRRTWTKNNRKKFKNQLFHLVIFNIERRGR